MDVYVYVYMGELKRENRQLDTQISYANIYTHTDGYVFRKRILNMSSF